MTRQHRSRCSLTDRLQASGAEVYSLPCIERRVLINREERQRYLRKLADFDWLVFTSPFAVQVFFGNERVRLPDTLKVAVVGPATAEALVPYGVPSDLMPRVYKAHNLVSEMRPLTGKRVCVPRSKRGNPAFISQLEAAGAVVTEIWTYDTWSLTPDSFLLTSLMKEVDTIVFMSGSAVKGFESGIFPCFQNKGCFGFPPGPDVPPEMFAKIKLVCIGPSTAAVCERLLKRVDAVADPHTEEGIFQTLIQMQYSGAKT